MSNEAIELIKNMLQKDKVKRFTIQECLEDQWFKLNHNQENNLNMQSVVKEDALVCLQSYQKLSKLFKAIRLINVKLGKQCSNLKELRTLFLN